jgi:hypothetical protein
VTIEIDKEFLVSITKTVTNPYPSKDKTTSTFAEGKTLRVWQGSVQVMSDVWEMSMFAEYWDDTTQSVQTEDWITSAKVDAPPDVVAKAEDWLYARSYDAAFQRQKAVEEQEARRIVKEAQVRVVSGRTGKGTEGKVVVVLQRPYGMGYRSTVEDKLGIATSEVKIKVPAANGRVYDNYRDVVWVWARNCELVEVPEIDLESVKERARNAAQYEVKGRRWSSPAR